MLDNIKGKLWMNGQLIDWQEAQVHILSHTLHYGSGVFEGVAVYNGKIFKAKEHFERFKQSAEILDFTIPYSVQELVEAAEQTVEINNLSNAYMRPVAWHGPESIGVASLNLSVHVAIATWSGDRYSDKDPQDGMSLMWSPWVRPAPNMSPVHAKANGQYIIGTLSRNQAEKSGFDDALLLDYRGYVAECSGANIFITKNGVVYTPTADCFLNGITRQTVIQLCRDLGIPCIEKHLSIEEVNQADEVFITGTSAEVRPIHTVGAQKFTIGPITLKLCDAYKTLTHPA